MSYPRDPSAAWVGHAQPTRAVPRLGGDALTEPLPAVDSGATAGGYPVPSYPPGVYAEQYGNGYDGDYADGGLRWWQQRGIVLALVAGVIVASGGFYAAYSFTRDAFGSPASSSAPPLPQVLPSAQPDSGALAPSGEPVETPPAEPSPTPDDDAEPFEDDDLRLFAGRIARDDDSCRPEDTSALQGVSEVVTCRFEDGVTVRFLKFEDEDARDDYRREVRQGLNGELRIRRDSVWAERGRRQGSFVSGSQDDGDAQYVYWDDFRSPVSGEVLLVGGDADDAERFWRREL